MTPPDADAAIVAAGAEAIAPPHSPPVAEPSALSAVAPVSTPATTAEQPAAIPALTVDAASRGESLGLTESDRRFLWVVGSSGVLLAGVHWLWLSGWGLQEVEIDRLPARVYDFRVDVNRATWVEWMQLEGIGELTARRIVADREERGPFHSIDELDRVSGIGPKTLDAIRPWLECTAGATSSDDR